MISKEKGWAKVLNYLVDFIYIIFLAAVLGIDAYRVFKSNETFCKKNLPGTKWANASIDCGYTPYIYTCLVDAMMLSMVLMGFIFKILIFRKKKSDQEEPFAETTKLVDVTKRGASQSI